MSKWRKIVLPLVVVASSYGAFELMVKFRPTVKASPIETPLSTVEVRPLDRVDYPFLIKSQGTVEAATSVRLISEVDGKVDSISTALKKGGFFSKGEVLVEIDSRDFSLAVIRASAQVATAKLRLVTVEAEAKIAIEDWEDQGREREASALLLRQPQLVEARSSMAAAEADLAQANLNLERTKLLAPFDGRVRMAGVDVGQFVRRGEELATLFGIESVEVSLSLPLSDLEFLDLPVERTLDAFLLKPTRVTLLGRFGTREQQWVGELVRVGGEIDIDSRMASVVVAVKDPYSREQNSESPPLRVGMFVEAEIQGKTAKGVYVVPRVQLWEKQKALAVDQEGKLRIRDLDVLRADRTHSVIKGGFEVGDRLCVTAIDIPQDGIDVNIAETKGVDVE
jgi:multidrug efflux system membrane fusion protein